MPYNFSLVLLNFTPQVKLVCTFLLKLLKGFWPSMFSDGFYPALCFHTTYNRVTPIPTVVLHAMFSSFSYSKFKLNNHVICRKCGKYQQVLHLKTHLDNQKKKKENKKRIISQIKLENFNLNFLSFLDFGVKACKLLILKH